MAVLDRPILCICPSPASTAADVGYAAARAAAASSRPPRWPRLPKPMRPPRATRTRRRLRPMPSQSYLHQRHVRAEHRCRRDADLCRRGGDQALYGYRVERLRCLDRQSGGAEFKLWARAKSTRTPPPSTLWPPPIRVPGPRSRPAKAAADAAYVDSVAPAAATEQSTTADAINVREVSDAGALQAFDNANAVASATADVASSTASYAQAAVKAAADRLLAEDRFLLGRRADV